MIRAGGNPRSPSRDALSGDAVALSRMSVFWAYPRGARCLFPLQPNHPVPRAVCRTFDQFCKMIKQEFGGTVFSAAHLNHFTEERGGAFKVAGQVRVARPIKRFQ